ncbi:MAG: hypothetical protein QE487_08820 [Fluviicola sp.]|nr:hypothetical protein [Fluviicola sp.]
MTHQEALVYLSIDSVDDAEEAYENQLFELKQHFLTKPILWKTAEGKMKRLAQLQAAYQTLGGTSPSLPISVESVTFSNDFQESFSMYHLRRNQLKQINASAENAVAVSDCVKQLLELERSFVQLFEGLDDWTESAVVLGAEPDVMLMQQQLKEQFALGRNTLPLLYSSKNNLPNELLLALKRLSLLKNYLYP